MRVSAAFFFVLGSAAIVLGGHDLLLAAQLTFRIIGAAVVLLGAALIAVTVGFARRRRWSYPFAVAAGLAAAAFAGMLFVAQWVTGIHGPRLFVWALMALACLTVAVVVGREGRVRLGGLARRRVQIASSVLSVGAVLSVAQFWNSAVRVPPASAPSVSVTSELQQFPAKNGLIRVAAKVKIRNSGASKVWVLGSLYRAWGGWSQPSERSPMAYSDLIATEGVKGRLGVGVERHADVYWLRLIETGTLLDELTYLVPGDDAAYDLLVHLPPKSSEDRPYEAVRFEADVVIAKDTLVLDDTNLEEPRKVENPRRIVKRRDIRETSWVARLLRGRREVRIELYVHYGSPVINPFLQVTVDRRGGESDPEDAEAARMARLYGVGVANSWSELALK